MTQTRILSRHLPSAVIQPPPPKILRLLAFAIGLLGIGIALVGLLTYHPIAFVIAVPPLCLLIARHILTGKRHKRKLMQLAFGRQTPGSCAFARDFDMYESVARATVA